MRRLFPLALAASLMAAAAPAQDVAPSVEEGRALYDRHCASCHGAGGEGDGPLAPALVIQPTDLTALQSDNGGIFPAEPIVRRIDGQDPLVSHGSPMPVFGPFFDGPEIAMKLPSGQPLIAPEAIVHLVAWLESVQD